MIVTLLIALMAVTDGNLKKHSDLSYGKDARQVLDVYLPPVVDQPLPTLFMVHGGGYVVGSKRILSPYAEYFAGRGYAVVVPNYRLAGKFPYPAPLEDVFCALAWTFANAETYEFDPARVAVIGESAGGNAAAMLAAVDEPERYLGGCDYNLSETAKPQALVTYYMYADLATCSVNGCGLVRYVSSIYLDTELSGLAPDALREAWGNASPLAWIDGSEPATLLIHGLADNVVPASESEAFAAALQAAGVQVETLFIPDAPHGFMEKFAVTGSLEARDTVEAFLEGLP
jgi:acetyl esterase/lipase